MHTTNERYATMGLMVEQLQKECESRGFREMANRLRNVSVTDANTAQVVHQMLRSTKVPRDLTIAEWWKATQQGLAWTLQIPRATA